MKLRHLAAGAAAVAGALGGAVAVAPPGAGAEPTAAPVRIAYLGIESGVYAQPGRHNDLQLAVDQINARGGIDGHQFQFTAYDTGLTPQQAVTATQQALAAGPTVLLGYSIDAQVQAVAPLLKQGGLPVLSVAEGPAAASPVVKVPTLFTVVPSGPVMSIEATTSYGVRTFHPRTVGIFHTDDTASNADAMAAQVFLKKLGVRSFNVQSASDTATDVTNQAVALKTADVIWEYGFPTVEAALNKALHQNGYTNPVMGDQSGNFLAAYGLNDDAELANYTFTPYCYPEVLPSDEAQAYSAAYGAAYPAANPLTSSAYVYDAVYLIAEAVERTGGELAPAALSRAIRTLTYHGVCGLYRSDANHYLIRNVALVSYRNGTKNPTLAGQYVELPLTRVQLSY